MVSFILTHTSKALYIASVPNKAMAVSMKEEIWHGSSKNELHGRSAVSTERWKGTWTLED